MKKFTGTGVALITPFRKDLSVDVEALKKLVRFQIENGIDYLVALGTTAENAALNQEEKKLVIETIATENNGRLPLVLGIGGNCTAKVIAEMNATNLIAIDAILSVSPYYNKPTQEGIFRHFKTIAEASAKPIILYNVPGRTASNMLPETVHRLASQCENIIGIKEAAGDMVQAMKLIALLPEDFLIISGDDMITLPMVLAGGDGVISVIGQGFPSEFSEMVRLGLQEEAKKAYNLHYKIFPCMELIFSEGNPAGIKAVLEKRGICQNNLRLPLVKASGELTQKISDFVDHS